MVTIAQIGGAVASRGLSGLIGGLGRREDGSKLRRQAAHFDRRIRRNAYFTDLKFQPLMHEMNEAARVKSMQNDRMFRRDALRNDLTSMVEGAQKAGFNPLTVLGATGGQSGFSPQGTMSPLSTHQSISSPQGEQRDLLGDFARGVGAAIGEYGDPIAAETRRLNNELTKAQTDTLRHQIAREQSAVPAVQSSQSPSESRSGGPLASDWGTADPGGLGDAARIKGGPLNERWTYYDPGTQELWVSPENYTPTGTLEEVTGQIASELGGLKHTGARYQAGWRRGYRDPSTGRITLKKPQMANREVEGPVMYPDQMVGPLTPETNYAITPHSWRSRYNMSGRD